MTDGGYKLFIVEGEEQEVKIMDIVKDFFFPHKKIKFITLPAGGNLYMLWNRLKEDNFETDLIEVIKEKWKNNEFGINDIRRDKIDEIFLFFDYDSQQKNLPQNVEPNVIIEEMLTTFSDETNLGKLYLSYPMIEAIRDWQSGTCKAKTSCVWNADEIVNYKKVSSENNQFVDLRKYDKECWQEIIYCYVVRMCCLMGFNSVPSHDDYKKYVIPLSIFEKQVEKYYINGEIFVLSAIPGFILDYFNERFWRSWVKFKRVDNRFCNNRKNP